MDSTNQYVSYYGIPYEVGGTFTDGEKALTIYGSMKDFDAFRMLGVVLNGRFRPDELIPITKEEADILKNISLRSPIKITQEIE
jgi:hypothetical protein